MHLHLGELLLSAVYLAAALIVLVAVFRGSNVRIHRGTQEWWQQPPVKRVEDKRIEDKRDDKNDRKVA